MGMAASRSIVHVPSSATFPTNTDSAEPNAWRTVWNMCARDECGAWVGGGIRIIICHLPSVVCFSPSAILFLDACATPVGRASEFVNRKCLANHDNTDAS